MGGDDVVSTYLQRKLWSNLREAEGELGRSSSIISRFQDLEKQILKKSSGCGIPVDVLYEVMGALSECRVFSYERPTAKATVSKKGFFYFIRMLHHPLSEILFMKRMRERLNDIEKKLRSLSSAGAPAPAPQPPVVPQIATTTTPISDIIGFETEAAQIEEWLIPSSDDTFTEIAIVGKWGCGKTALAQKVFATPNIEKEFSPLIWVCLSGTMPQQEQEEEARVRVVKCIEGKRGQDVWDKLKGKRYLMVLDDASWHWKGGLGLDLPKGSGGALILTTRREHDLGDNHVIRLEPQLSDDICWQIFSKVAVAKLDPTETLLSTIRTDVTRNSRGRPLALKKLGTIIPDLILQRKHWIRARDLRITWSGESRYWKWSNLDPPEEMEEVAELVAVCWLDIIGSLELHKLLLNRRYSAYLVYKLNEDREYLDEKMWGSVTITGKAEEGGDVYIDGDRPGPLPWAEAQGTEWLEIKLGEFINDSRADGAVVEARLFQNGPWKSGLVVKGITFRLNFN